MSSSTDRDLVQRLRERDVQALVRVYELHSARLLGFLLRLTRHQSLAEDLFQDTWCRLAASAHTLRPDTDLFAWLVTVARNGYFDRARHTARQSANDTNGAYDFLSCAHLPEEQSSCREQLRLLEQALLELSDLDREVLLLVGVEDLSHARAACILGISEVAFRKRLSRARERLALEMNRLTAVTSLPEGAAHE